MIIPKLKEFKINNKLVYSEFDIDLSIVNSYLVIDFTSMTKYPNVNALPAIQLIYNIFEDKQIIKNNFVILGGVKDICLI